jgi:hypothetical protein
MQRGVSPRTYGQDMVIESDRELGVVGIAPEMCPQAVLMSCV